MAFAPMPQLSNESFGSKAPKGLPLEVEFCSSCVISNQRPITKIESKHVICDHKQTTRFVDGVCDACRWANEKEQIDWEARETKLNALCDSHRSSDGSYDVIVPASGGKDSRYVAHILKTRYNMHPLTVTWKPHLYTQIGFDNLISMIDCGFDNILLSPNGAIQKLLCRLAFLNLGHPFQPFIMGQRVVGPKTALKYGVKLVFYGENVAEYGNRIEDNYLPTMDSSLYTCYDFNPGNTDSYMLAGCTISELIDNHSLSFHDLLPYQSPSQSDVEDAGVEVHYMSYYRKWVPQENYYYAVENTGFKPNPKRRDGSFSRYAGIDDAMEDLHYFLQVIKFGMGRCTWDAAQEVRTRKLERDEAVGLVRKYDQDVPSEYLVDILEYLDIDEENFWSTINLFRSKHLWEHTDNGFHLRHLVS